MTEYLVLTAIGADRTGIVSDLTKLASECGCNIVDSRMAVFGQEFTFIMLLNGDSRAINQIEIRLPKLAQSQELLTMMKRTSGYTSQALTHYYEVTYAGVDQPGILKAMTAFFATRAIDISSLTSKCDVTSNQNSGTMHIALTDKYCIEQLEHEFIELCQQIDVQGRITIIGTHLH